MRGRDARRAVASSVRFSHHTAPTLLALPFPRLPHRVRGVRGVDRWNFREEVRDEGVVRVRRGVLRVVASIFFLTNIP